MRNMSVRKQLHQRFRTKIARINFDSGLPEALLLSSNLKEVRIEKTDFFHD